MCYDRCVHEFWREEMLHLGGKHPSGKKAKVLDGDFKERLNFLQSIGVLTVDQQTFTGYAHDYRNESYHTGIVHDDIMHALAWHYHGVACDLFIALRHPYVSGDSDHPSPTWAKHGGSDGLYRGEESAYAGVAASLRASRPSLVPNLPDALATSIRSRLDNIQNNIDYLVTDSPKKVTEADVIRDIQYWDAYAKGFPGEMVRVRDTAAMAAVMKHDEFMRTEWKPKYARSPIRGWVERAERLRIVLNLGNALQTFAALRRDIEPFGAMANSSAGALGSHIDEQIKRVKEARTLL